MLSFLSLPCLGIDMLTLMFWRVIDAAEFSVVIYIIIGSSKDSQHAYSQKRGRLTDD